MEKINEQPEEIIKEVSQSGVLAKLRANRLKILSGILGISVFAGSVFGAYSLGQRQVQLAPQPTPTPTQIYAPTPTPVLEPTLIPITTPHPTPVVKTIPYQYIPGWKGYQSSQGFSFQYPDGFREFHQAHADDAPLGTIEGDFCQITSFREAAAPRFPGDGESSAFHVTSYSGGSRRELLIYNLRLTKSKIVSVEEVSISGLSGLEISFTPQYPTLGEVVRAVILIKGETTLMIELYQLETDDQEWYSLLSSLKVGPDFKLNLSKCKAD